MKLSTAKTTRTADRVIGVDPSTNSFAFSIIEKGKLVDYDEIKFSGSNLGEKMESARAASKVIAKHGADFALIEQTVFINNKSVAIKLAYFSGILFSAFIDEGIPFDDVVPITWQNHIDNGYFSKQEKAKIRKDNPGKSKSWYNSKIREIRKQRTIEFINDRFDTAVDNDNIADAVGIGVYAWEVSTKRG